MSSVAMARKKVDNEPGNTMLFAKGENNLIVQVWFEIISI
jgi:hypothetical protein